MTLLYQRIIEKLYLEPHPEGGYYRQLFGNDDTGKKDISTIYYMLTDNDKSAFHRLHGVTEIWYYHAGEPLNIYVIDANGNLTVHHLSPDGEMQQRFLRKKAIAWWAVPWLPLSVSKTSSLATETH